MTDPDATTPPRWGRRGPVGILAPILAVLVVGVGALIVERTVGRSDPAAEPGTETVVIEGPRGRILDRQGKVLVEDGTLLQVRADVASVAALGVDRRTALRDALALLLAADRAARVPSAGVATGVPITPSSLDERLASGDDVAALATGVGADVRDAIEAEPDRFPGITVDPIGGRVHHYGALAAHVLGQLGRATESELEMFDLPGGSEVIGKAGVERGWDHELRGEPGRIVYELDADGRRVRERTDLRTEPSPGRDVYLTLDIDLQFLVERGLAAEIERRRGVVDDGCFVGGGCDPPGAASVALDPRTGQVLALASYPTYDPMLFVGGTNTADYEAITDDMRRDVHRFPLLDRAVGGQYAPGSTLKPFTAHAGLAAGLITPDETYQDIGVYRYSADCPIDQEENNCSAQNAGRTPHGPIDLAAALRVSSDTYFYALGDEAWRSRGDLGEEALQEHLVTWGFGEPTGLDLPGEAPGRIPTPTWLRDFSEQLNADDPELAAAAGTWTPGVSGAMAAGHGDVLVTPLQLAQAYATLANGGTIWRPLLVGQTAEFGSADDVEVVEPESTGGVDLPAEWRDPIIAGLDGVTKDPEGTATTVFAGFDQGACPVMGKTGTSRTTGEDDTSVFAAVAPTPAPGRDSVIALATVVEGAGFSTAAAAPHARRVLEPFAEMGCDLTRFGGPDSPYAAPLGGGFDVAEAVAGFVPPAPTSSD